MNKLTDTQKRLLKILPQFLIGNFCETEPIYSNILYKKISNEFDFEFSVDDMIFVLDYIIEDTHVMDGLKRYDKEDSYWTQDGELCYDEEDGEGWIYYIDTFGIGIDEYRIFCNRFISNEKGFESGLTLLNRIGFTTMIPRKLEITSNSFETAYSDRGIPRSITQNITIKKPIIEINKNNVEYLRIVDIIKNVLDRYYPINIYNPIKKLQTMISDKNLEYSKIKEIASLYDFQGETDKNGIEVKRFLDGKLNKLINKIRHYY